MEMYVLSFYPQREALQRRERAGHAARCSSGVSLLSSFCAKSGSGGLAAQLGTRLSRLPLAQRVQGGAPRGE